MLVVIIVGCVNVDAENFVSVDQEFLDLIASYSDNATEIITSAMKISILEMGSRI